jgi:hypothetical protein
MVIAMVIPTLCSLRSRYQLSCVLVSQICSSLASLLNNGEGCFFTLKFLPIYEAELMKTIIIIA